MTDKVKMEIFVYYNDKKYCLADEMNNPTKENLINMIKNLLIGAKKTVKKLGILTDG